MELPETSVKALVSALEEDGWIVLEEDTNVEEYARHHLNMIHRDEVADIAINELHMTPEKE